ncbi:hypothetical protein M0R04_04700 [Candidatus Dojkabacteria bacterium]|jgi:hypothetical protein|nr:hypothetical protein [Candidatus Dojkabacteria bacterium]
MEESTVCYNCDQEFGYDFGNVYDSCDIVDGQYRVYSVVRCPFCECENEV